MSLLGALHFHSTIDHLPPLLPRLSKRLPVFHVDSYASKLPSFRPAPAMARPHPIDQARRTSQGALSCPATPLLIHVSPARGCPGNSTELLQATADRFSAQSCRLISRNRRASSRKDDRRRYRCGASSQATAANRTEHQKIRSTTR